MEYPSHGLTRPSQIQICPGYLKEQQQLKIRTLKDQGKKPSLARGLQKIGNWIDDPFRTPMDVACTFGTTLLHEMTHAIPNAKILDKKGGGKSASYGWKNSVKMSSDLENSGMTNADNYALFGLASRLISPRNGAPAQRPMRDGSIQALPAASGPSKPHVHTRADYMGTNITVTINHQPVTM